MMSFIIRRSSLPAFPATLRDFTPHRLNQAALVLKEDLRAIDLLDL